MHVFIQIFQCSVAMSQVKRYFFPSNLLIGPLTAKKTLSLFQALLFKEHNLYQRFVRYWLATTNKKLFGMQRGMLKWSKNIFAVREDYIFDD